MSTTYGFKKRETRLMAGFKYTLAILMGMLRSSLGAAWSMARVWLEYGYTLLTGQRQTCEARNKRGKYSQCGNVLFPVWECFIPNVGIKYSLNPHILRSLLFLMLVLGGKAWGQDYSGTYYIRSGSSNMSPSGDYYLCPTVDWAFFYTKDNVNSTDNGQPFLTTHKMDNGDEARYKWIIEKHTEGDHDYYAFKYSINYEYESSSYSRYLSYNRKLTGAGTDRLRIHLEKTENPGDYELFDITPYSTYLVISPKKKDEDENNTKKYLTVNGGNTNYFEGHYTSGGGVQNKDGGPNGFTITTGIIGTYKTISDANAPFYLEDYIKRPTISYDSDNKVIITPAQTGEVTIKYTTDGSDPVSNGVVYDTPLEPALGTTIKAVAIIGEEVSKIATFTYIKLADSYVIQSKDCEFYNLIPNLEISGTDYKNLTTLNVPCNTMVWKFENAVDGDGQYYYIHNSQGGYLYYTATGNSDKYVYFHADKDASDNGYKFSITPYTGTGGGYNIIPKGQTTPINKSSITANGNAKLTALKLAGAVGDATSRWALIPYNEETPRASLPQWGDADPFTESDGEHTYYYRINSVSQQDKPLILDNDEVIKSTTLPTSGYDNRKSVWVIKKVGTDTDGLLDYYTFQNAYTGEFLYLNKLEKEVKTDVSPGMLQMGQPDGADATWSHFVIVQTINNGYNIIPRVLVDNTKATGTGTTTHEGFNCINRANGSEYTGTWYDNDGGSRWTFEQKTDVKCMNPVYAEDTEGNFTISCVTNAAVIHYTTNGEEPTASSGVYSASAPIESASEKICIKAIAIVGNGADDYSKSNIITLMNKPDITLKEGTEVVDENTYIYDGTAKEPAVTISIGNVVAPTDTYTTGYANNTDAGTETSIPTATITYVDNDLWIIKPNTASKTFVINPRELTLTWTNTELEYTGTEQKPTLTVGNIVEGETLTVTVSIVEDGGGINMGTYTATATIEENSNYVLPTDVPLTTSYTITSKILGDGTDPASDISIDITYDGEAYTVTVKQGESTTLTEGESNDYTQTGSISANGKYYIVTVTGHGNYDGSFSAKYALMKFDHQTTSGEFSGTFVSDAEDGDFAVPDGMKAYIITDIRAALDQVVAVEVGYIPEGVPVLLLYDDNASANPASGFLVKEKSDETATVNTDNNLLKVTTAETPFSTGKIYLLYKGEFVLNKAGNLAAGKIYLDNTTGGVNASRLSIVWDESTGVEEIRGNMEEGRDGKWYTLDGHRLSGKPTKKGLYIRNGEKRVVR